MKFKEVRIIRHDSVRSMCIKEEYYTRGTNTEYSNLLFNLCDNDNASLEDLEKIAVDILEHSDWEKKAAEYGASYDELVRSVMTNLLNAPYVSVMNMNDKDVELHDSYGDLLNWLIRETP